MIVYFAARLSYKTRTSPTRRNKLIPVAQHQR